MDSLRVAFWIVLLSVGLLCLYRARRLGTDGLDEQGNVRDRVAYNWVAMWGVLGFCLVAFAVVDLLFLLNPPPAPMQR